MGERTPTVDDQIAELFEDDSDNPKYHTKFAAPYWHDPFTEEWGIPFDDFNREVIEPGELPDLPDGAVGIRMDDDFWTCAVLPLTYRDKTVSEICMELWPEHHHKMTFKPDSGDPWWQKYFTGRT